MLIVLKSTIKDSQISWIQEKLSKRGLSTHSLPGETRTVLAVVGTDLPDPREVEHFPGVREVFRVSKPYKLASLEASPNKKTSLVTIGDKGLTIGGPQVVVFAGPCSVEGEEPLLEIAHLVNKAGASVLRGGAFKPRTSPYSFQGMGLEGLKILKKASQETGMPVITEIMSIKDLDDIVEYADVLQIGARNMQNFDLLKAVGTSHKPVFLKRGISATIEELLMAAEYILSGPGNAEVILCERGIRTFNDQTRNTFDLSAICVLKEKTHLPVVADPSHATGNRDYVAAMAMAAVAAGADGLMIEVHQDPPAAFSDGAQSLYPDQFSKLMHDLQVIAPVVGRQIEGRHRHHQDVKTKQASLQLASQDQGIPTISLQGELGSYSDSAINQHFGTKTKKERVTTFRGIFEKVIEGKAQYGMVPLENALSGSIFANYDLLGESPVTIVGELKLRISHNLVALQGVEIDDIKTLYTHPQPAAQCERFLREHGDWQVIHTYDTAASAQYIKEQQLTDAAAISSAQACEYLGLQILVEGIETHAQNFTRFVVIAPAGHEVQDPDKISLVFKTDHQPGALYRALKVIEKHELNMLSLQSRPIPGQPWHYRFYVDIDYPSEGEDLLTLALTELKQEVENLQVLGRYRKA